MEAAIKSKVKKVLALSTDKAVNPVNLYGATKLCSDKVFIAANSYAGDQGTIFSVVRYGNVVGSRGSVVPVFQKQRSEGKITVTNPDMTRFLLTLSQGTEFVLNCLQNMVGGELFVPKISSCTVGEIAHLIAPDCKWDVIGLRPGEKMHEILIPQEESKYVLEFDNYFIIQPIETFWGNKIGVLGGVSCPKDFVYASNLNSEKIFQEQLKIILQEYLPK